MPAGKIDFCCLDRAKGLRLGEWERRCNDEVAKGGERGAGMYTEGGVYMWRWVW
jgi:hypothetical protein